MVSDGARVGEAMTWRALLVLCGERGNSVGLRYIGSKARLTDALAHFIGPPSRGDGMFVDVFCGTGAVGEVAARLGWHVRLNDHLRCAVVLSAARLVSPAQARFRRLGGYADVIEQLNRLPGQDGFNWREYSPASARVGARINAREQRFRRTETEPTGRRYFTEDNARRIDSVRAQIAEWADEAKITAVEERLLLADLLVAVNRIANIAGTYGCFLSTWSAGALQPLVLEARSLFPCVVHVEVCNDDARNVPVGEEDTAYLDPPYTKRQYAAYYHVLETIAVGDEPKVEGITGLRPWQDKASDFCYRKRALAALRDLVADLEGRRVLLSYSSEGHVELDELEAALSPLGQLAVHRIAEVGRYRPNRAASSAGASVQEYLLDLEKRQRRLRALG